MRTIRNGVLTSADAAAGRGGDDHRHVPPHITLIGFAACACLLGVATPADDSYPGANGRIAYVRPASTDPGTDTPNIWTMRSDGAGKRQLTTTNMDDDPVWSPDGTRIAYRHAGDIWIMNADGSHKTQLTTHLG